MSAPLTKSQLSLLAPKAASYAAAPAKVRQADGVFARLAAPFRAIAAYPRRAATIAELDRLTDRELADIGLNRGEIRGLFARG